MNRDDVIRMALEAGGYPPAPESIGTLLYMSQASLERFADLVSAEWQEKCNTYIELHDAVVKDNDRLYAAVANLIRVKGRHNTELAYQRLIAAYDKAQGDNK